MTTLCVIIAQPPEDDSGLRMNDYLRIFVMTRPQRSTEATRAIPVVPNKCPARTITVLSIDLNHLT